MAVTRTVSVGILGSCAKTETFDFSSERRHSSAGLRALLWATSGARSLGSFHGSEGHSSKENIFSKIQTRNSIPQFTIPSLSVQSVPRYTENDKERYGEEDNRETDEGLGLETAMSLSVSPSSLSSSYPNCSGSSTYPDRTAHRSISDPFILRKRAIRRESSFPCPQYLENQHCPDPASRAALSLPHLPKFTTPYGFVTLSQSPQMANEEALLCQAGQRRLQTSERHSSAVAAYHSRLPSTPRTSAINIGQGFPHQSSNTKILSRDSTTSQAAAEEERAVPEKKTLCRTSTPALSSLTSTPLRHSPIKEKPKRRLWAVIRKHFTSQ